MRDKTIDGQLHRKTKERYRAQVEAGQTTCARCFLLIAPKGEPCPRCGRPTTNGFAANGQCGWDLGHTLSRDDPDYDPSDFQGPEHSCCNRVAGGRHAARKTNRKHHIWSRTWLSDDFG